MFLSRAPALSCVAERGDGHPALVVPGFTASDNSTAPLRAVLRSNGYEVFGWELGTNTGPQRRVSPRRGPAGHHPRKPVPVPRRRPGARDADVADC